MLDNTIIIFTSDNGGPANGLNMNWATNYPLRGAKTTVFEGKLLTDIILWRYPLDFRGRRFLQQKVSRDRKIAKFRGFKFRDFYFFIENLRKKLSRFFKNLFNGNNFRGWDG